MSKELVEMKSLGYTQEKMIEKLKAKYEIDLTKGALSKHLKRTSDIIDRVIENNEDFQKTLAMRAFSSTRILEKLANELIEDSSELRKRARESLAAGDIDHLTWKTVNGQIDKLIKTIEVYSKTTGELVNSKITINQQINYSILAPKITNIMNKLVMEGYYKKLREPPISFWEKLGPIQKAEKEPEVEEKEPEEEIVAENLA